MNDDPTLARPPEETPTVVVSEPPTMGQLAPGAILGGRYRVVSLIGSGGMGAVYRGDDLKLGQPIAMKFLRRTSEMRERMLYDEVRIGRQVSHPNICRLYDIAEVDGQIFITMEFVDGEDLASLLRRIGRLPHDKAASVARDLCAGLAAAHEMGVIHRDLKPGNVMIDGRGRARITDFGLAVAESAREQAAAGTPAYMAPEQLAGGRASVQSDIYALGLVLYELFTGRRVFSGQSLTAILEQHRTTTITRPSELIKEIDPNIERTILHCLDPDPAQRPQSVPELMRELPSFDPLAAALAAGETPSPAMVAAASERGDLRAGTAWSLLGIALAATIGVALLSDRTIVVNRIGETKPPDVLLERTREVLAAAGLPAPARDRAWYYLPEAMSERGMPVHFVYRQSPRSMESTRFDRILSASDPPLSASGMATVIMDPAGRLVEMAIVPPQREPAPPPKSADFSTMFAQARIDRASLVPVASEWAAPVDSDTKHAWLVRGTTRRIEAASYHGKPVWFSVIDPATRPGRMVERSSPRANQIAFGTGLGMLLLLPVVTAFLALRNLRRGQGDRRGAMRIAVAMFILMFTSAVIRAHHVPSARDEWALLSVIVTANTFWALAFWLAYIALEPLLRRRWPHMLIAWSRLVEGRWRDPMIGRDLLIGAVLGTVAALSAHATYLLGGEPMATNITPIGSIRHTIYAILFNVSVQSVGRAMFGGVLILMLRAIFRRMDVVAPVAVILCALTAANVPGGPIAVRVVWAIAVSCVVYTVLIRYGLIAIAAGSFTVLSLTEMPFTGDPSSWYFATSMLNVGCVVALAIFAFWISLGGKSPLPKFAMD